MPTVAAPAARVRGDGGSGPKPLTFSRWFARRAFSSDLRLLLLELLTVNAFYRSQQLFRRMCLPVGGGPHAALQELSLEPAAHRADALMAAFPCGASRAGRLLYVLRTGAAVDPRVPLRLTDWGNAGYTVGQLLPLAVALAAPRLYERTRHGLFVVAGAATILGSIASALWTPDALLPLVAAASASAGRHRLGSFYLAWKAATTSQVPSHIQFPFGLALWALLMAGSVVLDRRLPPAPAQPTRLAGVPHAVVQYIVTAVLPYVVVRTRERLTLQPQYSSYLLGRAGGSQGSEGSSDSSSTCSDELVQQAGAGGNYAPVLSRQPQQQQQQQRQQPARSPVLYRHAGPNRRARGDVCGTVVLSLKVPLPPGPDGTVGRSQFQMGAEVVLRAADSALRPYLGGASGGAPAVLEAGGRGAGEPSGAVSGLYATSMVCVEGCVHLLMTARYVEGSGGGEGRAGPDAPVSLHHARLQQAGPEDTAGVDAAAVTAAMQRMLSEAMAEGGGDSARPSPQFPGAFVWPSAVPLTSPAAAEGGAGAGAAVLVLLPVALLRGLGAVRCVVAGPTGQPQGQVVHVDVWTAEGLGGPVSAPNEEEVLLRPSDYAALRIAMPPAALQVAGALMLLVLPAAAASSAPQPHCLHSAFAPPPPGAVVVAGEAPRTGAAPLAILPVLVLPADAALEVRQLLDGVIGEELTASFDEMLRAAAAAADEAASGRLQQPASQLLTGGGGGGSGGPSADAAAAVDAIEAAGLTGLSYDMGNLLQLPYDVSGEAAPPAAPGSEEDRGAAGGTEAGGGGAVVPERFDPRIANGRYLLRFLESQRMAACLREGLSSLRRSGVELGGSESGEAEDEAGWEVFEEAEDEPGEEVVEGAGEQAGAVPAALDPAERPGGSAPPQPAGPLWWLRVLLRGFSPPVLEYAYQAFKARRCRTLDCAALVLLAAVRLAGPIRTLHAMRAEGAAAPRAAEEPGAGELTGLQQQLLLTELVYAACGLVPAALASCTDLLQRRRNALLLQRVMLDAVALSCILMMSWIQVPMPLRVSAVWMDSCRRHGKHWLLNSVLVPAALQLSPRQQLWAALISLLPMTLMCYHANHNRWGSALAFGVGNALCGMAIAVITDLPTRRRFVRLQRSSGGGGGAVDKAAAKAA
ncbi:hypothetical protein TSOC_008980 [Tetrabaena socialis]|uniref:Uncharacterized protein n=1 Tax=Tetrabaena socialis TaxID=47790 RepID=A0A2J7ZX12_9CHLO|nr:hypothetical protein TSOC_008980 [Tetrabaena socialis]|eukprot:PNH04788.1 hypothetical protein TSOC_008980 [Tetrabaena socialis]